MQVVFNEKKNNKKRVLNVYIHTFRELIKIDGHYHLPEMDTRNDLHLVPHDSNTNRAVSKQCPKKLQILNLKNNSTYNSVVTFKSLLGKKI